MLFRSKTAIQIVFPRRLEKSNLSKAILQFENRVIFSALTQTISAIIILSNAEQLIQFSAFATELSNSIKGATKRPNIKLKASIPGSESLVGPRLRSKSRSKSYLRARDKVKIAKINKMHAFIVASYEVTESSKFSPPLKKNQIIARGAIPMSMIAKAALHRYRKGT